MRKHQSILKKINNKIKILFKSLKKYLKNNELEDTVQLKDKEINKLQGYVIFYKNDRDKYKNKNIKLEREIEELKEELQRYQDKELQRFEEN